MNPPPPLNDNNNNESIAHQAAKASLFSVPIVIGLGVAGSILAQQSHNPTQVAIILDLVVCVLVLMGLVAGIIALAGIPSYGSRGLLGRGLVGLALNGILIFIFATNFVSASRKAQTSRKALQDFTASTADIRSDLKKSFDPKKGITNVDVEKLDRLSSQLKNAAQNLSGDDARAANVMAGFLDRSRAAMKDYQAAVTELRAAHVLNHFDSEDKEQFAAKREVVQQFLQANSNLIQVITNAEDSIRAGLLKAQVSRANTESIVGGYHSSAASINAITVQIRQCDDRLGNAILGALDTLETQWGHWKFNPDTQKLIFTDAATREAYDKSITAMREAADEQIKWQAKLVNNQRVAQP